MSIEEQVVTKLIEKDFPITCAESCTGGQIASRIVDVANASKVLSVSFVTYANEAKIKYLGVSPDTIDRYGVVSEPVVREMAQGAAAEACCKAAIATSGVAGPAGGTPECPVGTVCFGFYVNGSVTTVTKQFDNLDRNGVRAAATDYALQKLYELLR